MPLTPKERSNDTDSYNDLFTEFADNHVWGDVTFTFQDGQVVRVVYQRTFRSVEEARNGLITSKRSHEEQPGGSDDACPNIHQNSESLQAK